jgi:hypothetical protein
MPSVRLGTGFVSVTVVTICTIPPAAIHSLIMWRMLSDYHGGRGQENMSLRSKAGLQVAVHKSALNAAQGSPCRQG